MKLHLRSFVTLAGLGLITACGGSKLTEEQETKFRELVKGTSSVISAAQAGKNGTTSALAVGDDSLRSQIAAKVNPTNCEFQTPDSDDLSSGIGTINLKVDGANCPLVMDIGMTLDVSEASGSARMRIYFEIKDAELAALSDVTKMDLSGTISGSQSSVSGNLSGSIQSKKYGTVGLGMTISGNPGEVTIEVAYQFTDFTVTLGMEISEDGVEYSVNGSGVSAEEFQRLTEGAGALPGMSTPQGGSGDTGGSSGDYSYNLTYNGCSTGKQSFPSIEAMCEGLQSESLNRGCAEELRRGQFQSYGCSGTFQLKP